MSHAGCSLHKVQMGIFVVLKETWPLKKFFVFEALPSLMLSDGYCAAVSTSTGLNLGYVSSSVLMDRQNECLTALTPAAMGEALLIQLNNLATFKDSELFHLCQQEALTV
ncbi:hypothetical protein AMECASPLE_030325 [Ameca splendens]|uniref:Uncharacterized protein n=1 Tax=Ameca splendens TaxID=208324 RepID=A0ABV1A2E8_9TELE